MNRILLLALPLLMVSVALAQPDGAKPPAADPPQNVPQLAPFTTPKDAAGYFLGAISSGSELNLSAVVAGAPVGYFGSDEWEKVRTELSTLRAIQDLKIDALNVDTQTATDATVTVTAHHEPKEKGGDEQVAPSQKFTLDLRLEKQATVPGWMNFAGRANVWRVVPPPIEQVLAKPPYETPPLQLAAALATRDPRLLPLIQQGRGLNQLKQLGLGAVQFVQDYDGFYAFDDAAHERALRPYLKDDSLFTIAGTKDAKWHFNDNLSTLSLAQVKEPALTVLFYDGEAPADDKLNFRIGDKTLIGFADGHCKALTKNELGDLIWKP